MADPASLITAGVTLVSNVAGNVIDGIFNTHIANKQNKVAQQNFELQEEQFEYEKDLQSTIMDREDNAIQRQVADSRAAGISPLVNLAGSQSAGAAGVAVNTPQRDYYAAQNVFGNALSSLFNGVATSGIADLLLKQKQVNADVTFKNALSSGLDWDNQFKQRSLEDRLNSIKYGSALTQAEYDDFIREYDYRVKNSVYKSAPNGLWANARNVFDWAFDGRSVGVQSAAEKEAFKKDAEVRAAVERQRQKAAQDELNAVSKFNDLVQDTIDQQSDVIKEVLDKNDKTKDKSDKAKQRYLRYMENTKRLREDASRAGHL